MKMFYLTKSGTIKRTQPQGRTGYVTLPPRPGQSQPRPAMPEPKPQGPSTLQQVGSGAAIGASVGSIIPGVGSGLGAVIGAGWGLISSWLD